MTPEEKRKLKRHGKEVAEQRSAAFLDALKQANPAPVGSDLWVQNYKTERENERWLAQQQPTHILASEVVKRFIPVSAQDTGTVEPWVECLDCHDVLHTYPPHSTQCSCGTVQVKYARPPRITAKNDHVRNVRLIARGMA
jgi:hypothetical protein